MAYDSNLHHSYPSLGWDLNNLGVFNADMSMVMENSTPFDSDISTGYLQDALIEWGNQCKRRRLISNGYDQPMSSDDVLQNYFNWNCTRDLSENFNCLNKIANMNIVSDHELINSSVSSISDGETAVQEIKPPEEAISASETLNSSTSSYKDLFKTTIISRNPLSCTYSGGGGGGGSDQTKLATGAVYPFAVVKPGGFEGVVTLNDINERILMRPTRPVKHPVGDFACRPCLSPDGPGLSGKAVVSFTKIQTQGRGTITIIRTRD